ncbi:MAG: hypothetical protein A3H96_03685 [Acidobacteria bacterium RIFCSPLOWO2_02_FULL_67_36]|nr:MAG: hypothetical protein A3H96_03685 [Acidobacteria bacterium RIFCSPLOWO2_02_FULL_67_36]OFW24650.1 MAG: hypothetical protein A3G21_17030 [Acidobacteria bacterium RIFCSPLOWO2_12_FULL_66_21]
MILSDTGESRVRGYLHIFERAMRAAQPRALTEDAVREVESHIRERVAEAQPMPNEREALERILDQLGTPGRVARAYSLELMMDEAAIGGRVVAVLRSLFHAAGTGTLAFFTALLLFTGYASGIALLSIAALKPIFPGNVGIWMRDGIPRAFGGQFPAPAGMEVAGGYWIIPFALAAGLALLVVSHRAARRWIGSLRAKRVAGRTE